MSLEMHPMIDKIYNKCLAYLRRLKALKIVPYLKALRPQALRIHLLAASFVIFVIAPTFVSALYYGLIASDRYVSGAGFSVRGVGGAGGTDMVKSFTGLASGSSTISDSYIVLKYLRSRDIVERISKDFDLKSSYSARGIDAFSSLNGDATIEELVAYWGKMISADFDLISGVITVEIQAFKPDDAKEIAELVMKNTQSLINELSETARKDSVQFAHEEVDLAEARLRRALETVRQFRNTEKSINPKDSAKMQMKLVSDLDAELVDIRTRIAVLSESMDSNAPTIMALKRQETALDAQIRQRTGAALPNIDGEVDSKGLSDLLASYEALEVEKTFAQKAYASALSSMEKARMEADRQQRYLAVYSAPALPQEAIYPRRFIDVVVIFLSALCFWAIGTLIAYAVRDHLS